METRDGVVAGPGDSDIGTASILALGAGGCYLRDITDGGYVWASAPQGILVDGMLVRYRFGSGAPFYERNINWSIGILAGRWIGAGWLVGRWERADGDAGWRWVEAALGDSDGSAGAGGEQGKGLGKGRREDDFTCWNCGNVGHGYRDTCGKCFHNRPVVIAAFEMA